MFGTGRTCHACGEELPNWIGTEEQRAATWHLVEAADYRPEHKLDTSCPACCSVVGYSGLPDLRASE